MKKSFQSGEEWRLFYCNSSLGCRVIQDNGLCKLDDLLRHNVDKKLCKITKYGISPGLKFCRVDVHQELHIMIVVMMSP